MLDTRSYQVEFPDGTALAYTANIITQNMIVQCDPDRNQKLLMKCIVGHKTGGMEILNKDQYIFKRGRRYP